jgi:uncharacterized protein involved in outer membrane biogenesis
LEGKLRLALWSLAAIVVIGLAAVLVAPLFISAEDVRNRVFAEIEGATGYRLTVNGPVHISAFPSLKLVAEDVGWRRVPAPVRSISRRRSSFASALRLRRS